MITITRSPLIQDSILEEQIRMEDTAVRDGVVRYRRLAQQAIDRGDGASLKPAERLLLFWFTPLVELIQGEQRAVKNGEQGRGRRTGGIPLLCIDAERLAVITINEVLCKLMKDTGGVETRRVIYAIGRAVIGEINLDLIRSHDRGRPREDRLLHQLSQRFRSMNVPRINWWAKRTLDDPVWSIRVAHQIGATLLWLLVSCAAADDFVDENDFHPAFFQKTVRQRVRTYSYIYMDKKVLRHLEHGHEIREMMRPVYLPMIVQPYPWSDDVQGGYVQIRTPFVNRPNREQKEAMKEANLDIVYAGVNALSSTPWRINQQIVDVIQEVWDRGGGELGIPSANDPPIPPYPDGESKKVVDAWRMNARAMHRQRDKDVGLRTSLFSKLDIARRMKDRDAFWLPHLIDFRGRTYPIPAHLNHHGNDVSRGMLEFADGYTLDDRARWWLKVHLANCYGISKVSFDDRAAWTDANMEHIRRSAADPIGYEWWQQRDEWAIGKSPKSWQVLAACFALTSDNAGEHLPVQMDGTCNGLQHYAAMGRDEDGAKLVNLMPGDVPEDIYTQVLNIVEKRVAVDADKGKLYAQRVLSVLDRSIVKPTVMTTVYGVSYVGARFQIRDGLKQRLDLSYEPMYDCSRYLANMVMTAMAEAAPGATAIMQWLKQASRRVAATNRVTAWKSPIGLPIVQPYYNTRDAEIITMMCCVKFYPDTTKVAAGKQSGGMAPNYVHGVDAAHMMCTAIDMIDDRQLTFAAVHDAYWTHAGTVDQMQESTRTQFIEIHRRPLLHELRESLEREYAVKIEEPPETGDFDIDLVMSAPYFFS